VGSDEPTGRPAAGAPPRAPVVDALVVGGGIVGLAVAWALQRRGRTDVLVLDKSAGPGFFQTGHNSGVIHSGIYYRPGSQKAELCVRGAELMKAFCASHEVPFSVNGKIIVATDEKELGRLEELERRGNANGTTGIVRLDADGIRAHEPHVVGLAGLYVPSTGATNYVDVARALEQDIRDAGGQVLWGQEVASVRRHGDVGVVEISGGHQFSARSVAVCAGLQGDRLAGMTRSARIIPFRGAYFDLVGEGPELIRSMVYPVPDPRFPFLGVHFTRHIDDSVSAGPNAVLHGARETHRRYAFKARDAADVITYPGFWRLAARYWRPGAKEVALDVSRRLYLLELRRYVPELEMEHLRTGTVGIRAQVVDRSGGLLDDFKIVHDGPVSFVLNAPSPAATASLAIGEHLAAAMNDDAEPGRRA